MTVPGDVKYGAPRVTFPEGSAPAQVGHDIQTRALSSHEGSILSLLVLIILFRSPLDSWNGTDLTKVQRGGFIKSAREEGKRAKRAVVWGPFINPVHSNVSGNVSFYLIFFPSHLLTAFLRKKNSNKTRSTNCRFKSRQPQMTMFKSRQHQLQPISHDGKAGREPKSGKSKERKHNQEKERILGRGEWFEKQS